MTDFLIESVKWTGHNELISTDCVSKIEFITYLNESE